FVIEPFIKHEQNEEFYLCIYSSRYCDTILFHHEGGIDIGDVDAKAVKLEIPVLEEVSDSDIKSKLLSNAPASAQEPLTKFIKALYTQYRNL
ncbi:hypothetical protein, partial [Pseudoalteromonas sp. SYSU M81241]